MNRCMMPSETEECHDFISDVVDTLCRPESYAAVHHATLHDQPMPSIKVLSKVVEQLRGILFPGYFSQADMRRETMQYHMGAMIEDVYVVLCEQIMRGYCFSCLDENSLTCNDCRRRARMTARRFVEKLPHIRAMLATDVQAAFNGDPAAKSPGEAIFCYPSIKAVSNYRIAHQLHTLGVGLIPRIITELAHSETGIDIHPGATIGEYFFIDHGTGTVIGETCIIGNNVRIYQGVTLGAKSFPKDEKTGVLVKDLPRHPIVEDNVIVYSGASILGRVTIGANSVIGGNVWITNDVEPDSRILQSRFEGEA